MRNAIRLFVKNAKCQEMLIEVLAGLVAANWEVGGDHDTSVADKTTEVYPYVCTHEYLYYMTHLRGSHHHRGPRARSLSLSLSLARSLCLSLSHTHSLSLSLSLSLADYR